MIPAEKPLIELIKEHLQGDLQGLPVFNSVAVKLQQMLVRRDFKMEEVIEMISEDQSLASQVLRVANSSYYAGLSSIATIKDAIVRLGAQEVANMVMMASQYELYRSENEFLNSSMQKLWIHSLACATGAKWLAKKASYTNLATESFMGGLLHDIGQLALLKVLDDIHRNKETKAAFSETLIKEILERMHEEVGYNLLKSWSLPEAYCSVAINHHKEDFDGNDILLVIVRLSDQACKKVGKSLHPDDSLSLVSSPEVQFLGLKEMALAELEIVIEDSGELNI
ncbi:MAG: HDOD domain-containing protein [Desulfuromonadaceae bacterium]|nr:HDOD domain-containing protein [Desulfuromonadaceae bacterium]MDD2847291.1 HDOD domain-containing protein [Desulfuromonadaceae bacterium]MDD4130235.1 HDOD domain-containing protein [Desulfuromonadaceae bacterium]